MLCAQKMAVRCDPLVGDRCNGRWNKRDGSVSLNMRGLSIADTPALGELTGLLLRYEAIDSRLLWDANKVSS